MCKQRAAQCEASKKGGGEGHHFSPLCSLKTKATAPLDKMRPCLNLSRRDKETTHQQRRGEKDRSEQ